MRTLKEDQAGAFIASLKKRASTSVYEDEIQKSVRKIVADVQKHGDSAVKKYTEKFDSLKLIRLSVSAKEIEAAARKTDDKFLKALKLSAARIRAFHERQKEKSWKFAKDGITLGQIIRPLERVGVYVPGGKAAYPSTVLMNVIPAQVAGVKEIALCVPTPDGRVNPYVAAAIKLLGVREVYRIGGAQAVAALAYGTRTINKVDKIVGPGNIFVAVAKKLVFGEAGIDMIAGPSEILIIADRTAEPSFIAADMLGQAEHDEMASSILITDSMIMAQAVEKELAVQLKKLKRKDIARKSLNKYGAIIITKNLDRAAEVANQIAPEHLEIMTRTPSKLLPMIRNAGAIFLGKWTPEPMGDYSAGPNHTLPTGGTARFSSPLGVYDFIKRTSLLDFSKAGFMGLADTVETFADVEGLEAHGNTVRIRRKNN
ncbi:MAG: histidinol dehydrogenase [Nitrospiraceae bacterium]|nr:MAG: histidinol dehydrogenase [Nitrospiraceae bacterium]